MVKMKHFVTALAVSAMCLLAPMQNVSAAESDNTGAQSDGQTYTQEYTLEVQSEDAVLGASYRTDFSKEINAEKVKDVKFYKIGDYLAMTCKVDIGIVPSGSTLMVSYRDADGEFIDITSSGNSKLNDEDTYTAAVIFGDDVKVGDKVALYAFTDIYNSTCKDDNTKEIVRFITIGEPEEWKGQAWYSYVYAGDDVSSYSIHANISGDMEISDSAYYALYSGDKLVAKSRSLGPRYSVNAMYLDGVSLYFNYNDVYDFEGMVYANKTLAAGKYEVKLIDGDKVYDFGERFTVQSEKIIYNPYSSIGYGSSSPIISVSTDGYTGAELLVELVDADGKVIATSNGGEYTVGSSNVLSFKLKSDYKLDDINKMSDLKIVVKSLDGTELYRGTYSGRYGVSAIFYDYYDDCVYAATCGIPDGTVVTASFTDSSSTPSKSYKTEGVVNEGRVFFYFTENGERLDLTTMIPDGQTSNYFSITLSWKNGDNDMSRYSSIDVYDNNRTDTTIFNTSRIENWYPVGTTPVTADIDIAASSLKSAGLEESTTYTFRVSTVSYYSSSSKYDKSEEIDAVVTPIIKTYGSGDIEGFNFKADIPVEALEAGRYYIILTPNTASSSLAYSTRVYSFSVADYGYMYSSIGCARITGDDTPYIYVKVPEYMRNTADADKLSFNITDVLGNPVDVQFTYSSSAADNSGWYFKVIGADLNANYYITANYDGSPVYALGDEGVKRKDVASYIGKVTPSTNVYFSSETKDGKETSEYYKLTSYIDGAKLEIREAGKFDVLRTMDIKKGYNYFTEDFLAGLSYDKLQFQYELKVIDADGKYVTSTTGYLASSNKAYESFDEEDDDTDNKLSGIVLAEDGNYYYYVNGAVATSFTGLAANDMGTFYFVNGKLDFSFNGFVYQNDTWWCVAGGRVCPDYTGLWSDAAVGWWYVKDGKIDFSFNGFVPFGDAWWCVAGGRVCFEYTGLWSDADVGWWYVENGAINFGFNGYVPFADAWWCVAGGRVCFEYTGLWSDANVGWWYTENGAINFGFNGLVPFGDAWWCVAGGRVAFEYTGLWYDANVGWWYVENGVINFGFSGAVDYNGGTYNVVGGMVVFG